MGKKLVLNTVTGHRQVVPESAANERVKYNPERYQIVEGADIVQLYDIQTKAVTFWTADVALEKFKSNPIKFYKDYSDTDIFDEDFEEFQDGKRTYYIPDSLLPAAKKNIEIKPLEGAAKVQADKAEAKRLADEKAYKEAQEKLEAEEKAKEEAELAAEAEKIEIEAKKAAEKQAATDEAIDKEQKEVKKPKSSKKK